MVVQSTITQLLDSVELKDRSLMISQIKQNQLSIETASHPVSLLVFMWRTGDLMKYTTGFIVGMQSMMTIRILACLITIASFLLVKFQASSSWDSSQSVYVRSWVPVLEDQSLGVYVSGFFDYKKICRNRKTLIISVESHLGLTFAIWITLATRSWIIFESSETVQGSLVRGDGWTGTLTWRCSTQTTREVAISGYGGSALVAAMAVLAGQGTTWTKADSWLNPHDDLICLLCFLDLSDVHLDVVCCLGNACVMHFGTEKEVVSEHRPGCYWPYDDELLAWTVNLRFSPKKLKNMQKGSPPLWESQANRKITTVNCFVQFVCHIGMGVCSMCSP